MHKLKDMAKASTIWIANRSSFTWRLARFIYQNTTAHEADELNRYCYPSLRRQFIRNGTTSEYSSTVRSDIARRFDAIDEATHVLSSPSDGLFMAEALLRLSPGGDIVECGCYMGGSSAKLSILAKITGRKLTVFDSFEGLPTTQKGDAADRNLGKSKAPDWSPGRYSARLDAARHTVSKYGEPASTTFVKGWFSDTLVDENLPETIAFVFTDVDLATSAADCLRALWPRLADGAVYFSHDVGFVKVLQTLYDPELWRDVLKSSPPILYGAGFGICDGSPHLGYFIKGPCSQEYMKALTIYQ